MLFNITLRFILKYLINYYNNIRKNNKIIRRNYLCAKFYLLPLCNDIILPKNLLLNIIIINYYLFLYFFK